MKYKDIFFDLDGTIIDSSKGVMECLNKTLQKYGYSFDDEYLKSKIIGPPLYKGLSDIGIKDNMEKIVFEFRKCYKRDGVYQNTLYEGIKSVLEELKKYNLYIITSKPQQFAEIILKEHNIDKYFKVIDGAKEDDKISKKSEKLKKYIKDKKTAIMIGDRCEDIIAAKNNQIASIGLTYGYENINGLKECTPTFIANSSFEILQFLKGDDE
jgi:phosphoglycolate phosphatase